MSTERNQWAADWTESAALNIAGPRLNIDKMVQPLLCSGGVNELDAFLHLLRSKFSCIGHIFPQGTTNLVKCMITHLDTLMID